MNPRNLASRLSLLWTLIFLPMIAFGQGKLADYERANGLRDKYQGLATNIMERPTWGEKDHRFWYRKSVKGGNEFVLVEIESQTKKTPFNQEKLASSLSAVSGERYTGLTLPFTAFTFVDSANAIEFEVADVRWKCTLSDYACKKLGPAERRGRRAIPGGDQAQPQMKASPDGVREAFIKNFNIYLRTKDKKEEFALSFDGSEGNYYTLESIAWSPDSKKLAAYRVRPGYHRKIQYVESSPADQLQPKYSSIEYVKPGDALDIEQPVLFLVEGRKQFNIENSLFPNAYEMSELTWWKDSRGFTFEYNQRGHQVYRVIDVDAASGRARAVINEECKTFFCYSSKKYRYDVNDGKEMVWMSERDGWNHLYLYDARTGKVKNRITEGNWVIRGVDKVDEERRQVYFSASGRFPGKDPYLMYYYRIGFDGTGLTPMTEEEGTHRVTYSSDFKYYVDTWSQVDRPPVSVLKRASDQKIVMELERANIQELLKVGWKAPEVFTAIGRDGRTDIWGIILRPSGFDETKKFPVIEYIYAGPHSSFVPKSFSSYYTMQSLAELGFIVVQIDGMGTSNRSKAFHDVCWKNLADAGFPDRILWHKAAAAKYPWYDISSVGIYGHSAGGQSTLGALLSHPEFYKVGVASCGCHDNRMDKIWWNEQWMGWPLGPEYAASSNVDNAYRLQGKLLLTVGEMDNNVDPASTMQVVNALIKANKVFEFLVFPGLGHSTGGVYGDRKRYDFFVQNLLGVAPPDWNRIEKKK